MSVWIFILGSALFVFCLGRKFSGVFLFWALVCRQFIRNHKGGEVCSHMCMSMIVFEFLEILSYKMLRLFRYRRRRGDC